MEATNYQVRRCELGIHNFVNFMDSPLEIEYRLDIPEEVLVCKVCKHMMTPFEIFRLGVSGGGDPDLL